MKIIWAFDAFEDNRELNQKMADSITALYNATQADVEPLYLLRENEITIPTYETSTWGPDHSRTAESLFREVLSDYNLPFLQKATVLPHASPSHVGAAETLSQYASRCKADLIVVGSHSREGLQRFLLGSFTESLLSQAEVPVFVIGQHTVKTKNLKMILHPTEFGEHSKENFRHILKLAQKLRSEILLLHAIERPLEGLFELETRPKVFSYKGRLMTLEQIVESQIENQARRAQVWADWAAKEGVIAHFFIDSSFKAVDDLILNAVEAHEADLIVMEGQSGPLSSTLLGSYTRNVARKSPCPVYVIPRHFYDKQEDHFGEAPAP